LALLGIMPFAACGNNDAPAAATGDSDLPGTGIHTNHAPWRWERLMDHAAEVYLHLMP